jgi:hypothetical protein
MNFYTFQVTLKLLDSHTVVSVTNYLACCDEPPVCSDLCDALSVPGSSELIAHFDDPAPVNVIEYEDVVTQPAITHDNIKIWRISFLDCGNNTDINITSK